MSPGFRWAARITALALLAQCASPAALAARSEYETEIRQIPSKPSAPPKLGVDTPQEHFKCERLYIYRGKQLNCDSNVRQDAERLRPILQGVPQSIGELNSYQKNRRAVRGLAYLGTAGLLVAIASAFVPQDPDAQVISTRNALLIGGLSLTSGSLLYGLSLIRTNEAHLGAAVDIYNKSNPKDPIELKFSTGITF
jgi:hypothetical protein